MREIKRMKTTEKSYRMSSENKKKNWKYRSPSDLDYRECIVEGCVAHGCYHGKYCSRHYTQLRIYGKIFKSRFDINEVEYFNTYAEIILGDMQRQEIARAKVSLHRVEDLLRWKWSLTDSKYPHARDIDRGGNIKMARLIMNVLDDESVVIGYRNGDTLDNRDENLFISNRQLMAIAMKTPITNTSGYKGVGKTVRKGKWTGKWRAYITVNGKQISLGSTFGSLDDALGARRKAEEKYFKVSDVFTRNPNS